MQFSFENQPREFGYAVLNGMGIESSFIKRYKVCEGDEVILASNGYPVVAGNLVESEEILQRLLQEDLVCFREYRCTKASRLGM